MQQRLISKIVRGFSRDQHLTLGERLQKGAKLVSETAMASVALRSCDEVGPGARVAGRMRVENRGTILVGSGLMVISTFLPVEIIAEPGGRVELGDHVWINFGTIISARSSVKIGNGVMMGQHCIIADSELPSPSANGATSGRDGAAKPVEIGAEAWLAGRVTIRPGVTIGEGAVITAGSIVETDIPPRVVAGGIPARVLRSTDGSPRSARDVSLVEASAVTASGSLASPSSALDASGALDALGGASASAARGAATGASASVGVAPAASLPGAIPAAPRFTGTIASDFTIDELADELRLSSTLPGVGVVVAPFGQVTQVLLEEPAEGAGDFLVVWTRPETAIGGFARTVAFEKVDEKDLLSEVDAFCSLVEQAAPRYKFVFVPTWTIASWARGLGMLDAREGGVSRALMAMNLRLADNLAKTSNVFVLDAERWLRAATGTTTSPKGWYLGKMAVSRPVMAEAAADIQAAIFGLAGGARKLLVVDLDDTMWGGIVGDAGWEGLRLGGHDGVGEAFVDFQRAVKNLKRRGIILAIVSKNEEATALEAIRRHPAMVLQEDDFVGWRINWIDKAQNIAELAQELNLGLQSVVFIDDNPVERARVREALPEVFVPEWPEDKLLYPSALLRLRCFDSPARSAEDMERTRLYAEERKRDQLQKQVGSMGEWLKSLEIKVRAEPLGKSNLARATQLLNKTNQLNLATRRLTEAELLAWADDARRKFWTVSVSDRFGDAGLTGLVSIECDGDSARIVDYVLSCRVMGRKVEETMVHLAVSAARERAARTVTAEYLATAKNKPCLTFWLASGFAGSESHVFTWDTEAHYALPEAIDLAWEK